MLDPEGLVISWNRAAERIFGFGAEEVLGRPLPIVPEDKLGEFEALRRRVLEGESLSDVEILRRRRDGNEIAVSLSAAPVRDRAGAVVGIMAVLLDLGPRKEAERALADLEARGRAIVERLPIPTFIWQRRGEGFVLAGFNAAAVGMTEGGVSGWLGKELRVLYSDGPDIVRDIERCFSERTVLEREMSYRYRTRSGSRILAVTYGFVPPDLVLVHTQDVTAIRQAEEQLRISQRLEAVGRLAGGVAHEFNNLLTVIAGYTSFALDALREGDPIRQDLEESQKAVRSAAELTQQLLAFGRKQLLAPRVLNLNRAVVELEKILVRLLGEQIEVEIRLAKGLHSVLADPGQVSQVIVNLALNARDAMPDGGKLTIETANVEVDGQAPLLPAGLPPGPYARLTVTDTGAGMDAQTRERVFEPFFTTKGRGVGLGLATVYGIVTQSRGHVWVESALGAGSAFSVILPRAEGQEQAEESRDAALVEPRGRETVLVVEDGEAVRLLAGRILEEAGYKVLAAAGPVEALRLCEELRREGGDSGGGAIGVAAIAVMGGEAGDDVNSGATGSGPGPGPVAGSGPGLELGSGPGPGPVAGSGPGLEPGSGPGPGAGSGPGSGAGPGPGGIDLLLTDVVMPEMNGRQLADLLSCKMPTLEVIFMSGYTDSAIGRHGVLEPGTHFIAKPFTAVALTRKVRAVLDARPAKMRR
jgi:PAS domain S-box-containing protein